MSMPFYVSPEQQFKDKADYARKGISKGSPLVVVEYDKGVAFIAVNPSTHLHKVGELYDRIAFAAVGRVSEFEMLRQAGVRLADVKGYTTSREDVTSRAIASAYSQTLNQVFQEQPKPFEVELCVAELGAAGEPNAVYHVTFDGTMIDRKGYLAIGGQADTLSATLKDAYTDGWDLDAALRVAVNALRSVSPQGNGEPTRMEVAVLEHGPARRTFRRLDSDDVDARLRSPKPATNGSAASAKPAAAKPASAKPAGTKPAGTKPAARPGATQRGAAAQPDTGDEPDTGSQPDPGDTNGAGSAG